MTETPQQTPSLGAPAGPEAPPPPGWNTEHLKDYRQLRRAREDRKVAGVAGGLGRHLDVDPTVLRVLFVVLALFGGAGLVLYAALWVLVPEEGSERTVLSTNDRTRNVLLIGSLIVAGLIVVGDSLHGFSFPWLLAAALVVAAVLVTRDRGQSPPAAPPGRAAPPGAVPWAGTGSPVPPPPPPTQGGGARYPPAPPPVPQRPRRTGPLLVGPTVALVALALGVLGLYDASGGSVADSAYPALALAVTGLMLLVGAFVGRAGGLIAVGLVAAALLAVTAIGRPSFHGDRNLVVRPLSASQVHDSYEVPAGRVELDLSRITDPEALDGRTVDVSANAGEILVVVPRNVDVHYTADVQYGGAIDTPGSTHSGWGPSVSSAIGPPGAATTMDLDLHLEFGHIQLVRSGSTPVPDPATKAPRSKR